MKTLKAAYNAGRELCLWFLLVLLAILSLASMTVFPGVLLVMGAGVRGVIAGAALAWLFWRGVKLVLCRLSS